MYTHVCMLYIYIYIIIWEFKLMLETCIPTCCCILFDIGVRPCKAIVDLPLQMVYFSQYFADKVRDGASFLAWLSPTIQKKTKQIIKIHRHRKIHVCAAEILLQPGTEKSPLLETLIYVARNIWSLWNMSMWQQCHMPSCDKFVLCQRCIPSINALR